VTAVVARVEVSTDHRIGGRRVPSFDGSTFDDVSPIDESVIAQVARGSAADADAAVGAAREAFSVWGAMPAPDRAAVLHAIANGVEKRVEDLAHVEIGRASCRERV